MGEKIKYGNSNLPCHLDKFSFHKINSKEYGFKIAKTDCNLHEFVNSILWKIILGLWVEYNFLQASEQNSGQLVTM